MHVVGSAVLVISTLISSKVLLKVGFVLKCRSTNQPLLAAPSHLLLVLVTVILAIV